MGAVSRVESTEGKGVHSSKNCSQAVCQEYAGEYKCVASVERHHGACDILKLYVAPIFVHCVVPGAKLNGDNSYAASPILIF